VSPVALALLEAGRDYVTPVTFIIDAQPRLFAEHNDEYYYFDRRLGGTYAYLK
jgi:hypothetical protein